MFKVEIERATNGFVLRRIESGKVSMQNGITTIDNPQPEPTIHNDFDSLVDTLQLLFAIKGKLQQ